MKSYEHLSKINIAELRLYELLGVKWFKKLVLLLEHLKHKTKTSQNENYHPKNMSAGTLRRFSGYLVYNSVLHVVSLLLGIAYFVLSRIQTLHSTILDCGMVALIILNLYCIMLQRYTYLRFKEHINKTQNRKEAKRAEHIVAIATTLDRLDIPLPTIDSALLLIQDMQCHLLSGQDLILSPDSAVVLSGIADACCSQLHTTPSSAPANAGSLSELTRALPQKANVTSATQRRVVGLQKLLRFRTEQLVCFGTCVITENAEVELAYRRVFPDPNLESITETLDVLSGAYRLRQKVLVGS